MEKYTPHCNLSVVKVMLEARKVRITMSALQGAAALELDANGVIDVVMALSPKDFYKSMTSHSDHRIWHDVYRTTTHVGEVYLKLIVTDDLLIVSFKEL